MIAGHSIMAWSDHGLHNSMLFIEGEIIVLTCQYMAKYHASLLMDRLTSLYRSVRIKCRQRGRLFLSEKLWAQVGKAHGHSWFIATFLRGIVNEKIRSGNQ